MVRNKTSILAPTHIDFDSLDIGTHAATTIADKVYFYILMKDLVKKMPKYVVESIKENCLITIKLKQF